MMKKAMVVGLVTLTMSVFAAPKVHGPAFAKKTQAPMGPVIRVLVAEKVNSALLEAKGGYRVVRRESSTYLSSGVHGKRYAVHAINGGLRWGEEYPDIHNLTLIPTSLDTTFFVNGFQYKGAISVYHEKDSHQITVVNEVAIEDYVKSVMNLRFHEEIDREALSALAILERTHAYNKVMGSRRGGSMFDVKAADVGYYGFGVTRLDNGVDAAVDWTPYMVMEEGRSKVPLEGMHLKVSKAQELAKTGCNAQKILTTSFPQTRLGITTDPEQLVVR